MSKQFTKSETRIRELFCPGADFVFMGKKYIIETAGKPRPSSGKGEPKTDVYMRAKSSDGFREFKISFKQGNHDFLENKISSKRAEQIFGVNWADIVKSHVVSIVDRFKQKPLASRALKGDPSSHFSKFTLGWRLDIVNKSNGFLSAKANLTHEQKIEIYTGKNLSIEKRDAKVDNKIIPNSGVANYILIEIENISDVQSAVDQLITPQDFIEAHPDVYFVCKALNYFPEQRKYDGDRPLAVMIDWSLRENKLHPKLIFDAPLAYTGKVAKKHFEDAVIQLDLGPSNQIHSQNLFDLTFTE